MNRAIFLDRDGVINEDLGYVSKIEDFKFLPNVFESLKKLQLAGFKLFIITNQSGIGRKYYSLEDFKKLNEYMQEIFRSHGIKIEEVFFCPHHPEEKCECRKPSPFFLKKAEKEYSIDLYNSWVIGDRLGDIEMGKNSDCKTLLIDSRYNVEYSGKKFKDLEECSRVILNNEIFPKEKVKTLPLNERKSKSEFANIIFPTLTLTDDKRLIRIAEKILLAKKNKRPIIISFGAHLIKNGLSTVLKKMIDEGYVSHLATNGAGSIHDWEFSFQGKSEEDVRENIKIGRFGTWEETGKFLNLALISGALKKRGYGESIGEMISKDKIIFPDSIDYILKRKIIEKNISKEISVLHKFKEYSIQKHAFENKIPFTIHPGFGYDIIYTYPLCDGASIGKTSEIDFLKFVNSVSNLEGGVYLSIGSAIMSPMIFEKALSMARNVKIQENKEIKDFLIAINDIKPSVWEFGKNNEPKKSSPEYYERFSKSFDRMGAREMIYVESDNRDFLLSLFSILKKLEEKTNSLII